jgi:hypothetical protein
MVYFHVDTFFVSFHRLFFLLFFQALRFVSLILLKNVLYSKWTFQICVLLVFDLILSMMFIFHHLHMKIIWIDGVVGVTEFLLYILMINIGICVLDCMYYLRVIIIVFTAMGTTNLTFNKFRIVITVY